MRPELTTALYSRLNRATDDMDEGAYIQGSRMAWRTMLAECLRQLGYDDPATDHARFVLEREAIIAQLRDLCAEQGDNDWDETLHLGDVIEKHLARHLLK